MSAPVLPEIVTPAEPDSLLSAAFPDPPTLTTLAARNQNPGNLRDPRTGSFRSFGSPQEGFDALLRDVQAKQSGRTRTGLSGDSTILEFFNIYAPPHENDTEHYALTVAKRLGVDVTAKIKDLPTEDLARAIAAHEDHEYWNRIEEQVVATGIQPLKTSETEVQEVDDSLLDAAFATDVRSSSQKLIDGYRESERARRNVTPEQQMELLERAAAAPKPRDSLEAAMNPTVVQDVTGMQIPAMSEEERAVGERQLAGEGRADFLSRTAPKRKMLAELDDVLNPQSSIGPQKTGWERLKDNMGNLRLFAGGQIVSMDQGPGGVDIGQMFRLSQQILEPTVGETLEGNFDTAFTNFLGIGGGFAKALIDPFIGMPAGLVYDAASRMEGRPNLLPEERETYLRTSLANYAGIFVGYGAGRIYSGGKTAILTAGRTSIAEVPMAELNALRRITLPSRFRARVIRGSVEGVAGGITAGVIEGKTMEEKRDLAISYVMMGLPLGLAFEAVGAGLARGAPATIDEAVVRDASHMFSLKQLRVTENVTPDRAATNLYSLATEQDLATAAIRTGTLSGEPVIVTGIDNADKANITRDFNWKNITDEGAVHDRPDGKQDLLVMRDFGPEAAEAVTSVPPNANLGSYTLALREAGHTEPSATRPGYYNFKDDNGEVIASVKLEFGSTSRPENSVTVEEVSSSVRGGGRRAMEILIREADKQGIILEGKAFPLSSLVTVDQAGKTIEVGKKLSQQELNKFYEGFGFKILDNENNMVRIPEKSTAPIRAFRAIDAASTADDTAPLFFGTDRVLPEATLEQLKDGAIHEFDVDIKKAANDEDMIRAAQAALDLPETGIADNATWMAIENAMPDHALHEIPDFVYAPKVLAELKKRGFDGYLGNDIYSSSKVMEGRGPVAITFNSGQARRVVREVALPQLKDNRRAKAMFAVSGFMPDQAVHFLGQDYTYKGPIIGKGGKLEGHTIIDFLGTEYEVGVGLLQRHADVLISPLEFDKFRAQKALYKDFKLTVNTLFDADGKLKPDAIPDVPFSQLIDKYIVSRRLAPEEAVPLRNFLEERFGQDLLHQSLSPEERAVYQRLVSENARYKAENPQDIVDLATSSGFYVERNGGSAMILRDVETGARQGSFNSNESLRTFILESGRPEGVALDGNGTVPPAGVGKAVMATPPPPNGPHTVPFNFLKDGPLRQFSHWFNTTLLGTRITGMRQIMTALDAQLGTRFAAEVWDANDAAFRRKHAMAHEDMKRAAGIAQMARGMSVEELDNVTTLMETMAADDMVKQGGLFKTRAFTDREIAGANWFIDNKIDIAKAFQYRRALINLERGGKVPPDELGTAIRKLQAAMAVDEKHVEAARIIGEVLRMNSPGEVSIYGITRLANAMMNGDLSPAAYITANKLSPRAVKLAEVIREHLDELAPKFDIPEESRLGGYFSHYRNFQDDIPIVNQDNIPVFVSDLLRTGEMTDYDRDPINVLVRYINAGYNRKFTKQVWDNAAKYIDRVTARMGEDGPYIARLLKDNYLNELRGIPHDSSKLSQGFLDKFLERIGVKTTVNARRDLVNTALSLSSSAAIGFRPMQGLRDVHNFVSIFYSRFGTKRTADMLSIIAQYGPEELKAMGIITETAQGEGAVNAMRREGVIPGISPVAVVTQEELLQNSLSAKTTRFREIVQKTGELGIKWGLQHNVYQWAHAASYLEGYVRGLRTLNDLVHGKFGSGTEAKAKAYRELAIDSYDVPVIQEFDRLVIEGKFEDAAKFLGRANSFETVSIFGLANHPAGWGTNTGRLLGQFGSWPVWARSQLMRLMSRGSIKDRTLAVARFGMTQGATKGASWAMGLNLSSWFLVPGALGFRGGPAAGMVGAEIAYIGGDDRAQSFARDAAQAISGDFGEDNLKHLTRQLMLGIPASFMAKDVIEAAQMAGAGVNPISALARAFSVRSTAEPSMLNPYGVTQP